MDDAKIVDLFWERSEIAIDEAFQKYSKYCHSISYRILRNTEDADECVNDTFFKAWNAIPPAKPTRLSTFLGKITRNLSLNKYEKLGAKKRGSGQIELALTELEECIPSATDVETEVERILNDMEIADMIDSFLTSLPKINRKVFVRRYWYLNTIEEISNEYEMSNSKVKSILFRARKKLRTYLEKEGITL